MPASWRAPERRAELDSNDMRSVTPSALQSGQGALHWALPGAGAEQTTATPYADTLLARASAVLQLCLTGLAAARASGSGGSACLYYFVLP